MWLKLLFAVVSLLVSNDSPSPNTPDQTPNSPSIPQDNTSNTSNNPTDVPGTDTNNPNPPTPVPDNEMLNLHIMVASHTDAGWIHTFERYYQGTNSQDGGCVKCILDNVLSALPGHADRKYDMSEISFFKRWWIDQDQEKKNRFKTMLQNKQFEFINGAWAANDEATAYYEDIMDNFILGHRWLQDNLDVDPLIGWQVDSFGNSATHAGLMAQAGYEGMFFSRADYVDRDTRRAQKSLQFNWAPPNPHNETVFTQMMYVTYSDTKFMIADNYNCRSVFCHGNLNPDQYKQVADYAKKQQSAFRTKNILFMVCDDFLLWQGAEKDYVGAEAMVEYYKNNPQYGIKAQISHLSDYLNKVKEDLISLGQVGHIPEKHDDTFPFVEKNGHVWTGYFTSKPMFKLLVREYSEYYNAVKLLLAKIMLTDNWSSDQHSSVNQALTGLEEPLAIVQHHDAVSGTMKENVRFDYEDMLNNARNNLETTIEPLIINYIKGRTNDDLTPYPFKYDWLYTDKTNVFNADSTTTFIAFNPGQTRKLLIKVKIPSYDYQVIDESNTPVNTDTICSSEDTNSDCYIYFVDEFQGYTTKVYKVVQSSSAHKLIPTQIDNQDQDLSTGGLTFKVKGDLKNFEYNYCQDGSNCAGDSFSLNYQYYESAKSGGQSPSGAYVFTPIPQEKKDYSNLKSGRVFKGKYISLVQIFRDKLRTDISVYSHQLERGVEITTFLDPLEVQPAGKEIVLVVNSGSIKNGDTEFYTDANGYYMQKRIKNHKDNFQLDTSNSVSVNYYPMTSNMYIEDASSGTRLSIVTDRAQGTSSLNPGQVEVMIHRVTTNDDWKGVAEALQEKERGTWNLIRVTTRHFLTFSNSKSGVPDQRRNQQYDLDRPVQLWFYSSKNAAFPGPANAEAQTEQVVPDFVKLYVRSYTPNEYIIRLHNLDEINSKEVQLYDLQSKVSGLLKQLTAGKSVNVKSIEELSWMTTREKSDVLKNVLDPNEPDVTHEDKPDYSAISLLPMEIRTFSIEVEV